MDRLMCNVIYHLLPPPHLLLLLLLSLPTSTSSRIATPHISPQDSPSLLRVSPASIDIIDGRRQEKQMNMDAEVTRVPPARVQRASMDEILDGAKKATDKEHSMSLWQGLKLYPKAVGWSMLISTCIAMEGYDISLLTNFCES